MLGEKNHAPKTLRAVYVPMYPRHRCFTQYKTHDIVTSRMICAAYNEGGMDACKRIVSFILFVITYFTDLGYKMDLESQDILPLVTIWLEYIFLSHNLINYNF